MNLNRYFERDDGSLPEIEVAFVSLAQASEAFHHVLACGARDVTCGDSPLRIRGAQAEERRDAAATAALAANDVVDPVHVVLGGITIDGVSIPDLGVFVSMDGFTFDYRMGLAWGMQEIHAFISLLQQLRMLGGVVSVPWWGVEGERDFQEALCIDIRKTHHIDSDEPDENGFVSYHYEYDIYAFTQDELRLVARSYVHSPLEGKRQGTPTNPRFLQMKRSRDAQSRRNSLMVPIRKSFDHGRSSLAGRDVVCIRSQLSRIANRTPFNHC